MDPVEKFEPGLTAYQWDAVHAEEEELAFVGGYASGKTEALFWRAIHLLGRDRQPIAVYGPTSSELTDTIIPRFEQHLDALRWSYRPAGLLRPQIRIAGLPRILFRSMERPERIVGYQVAHALVDEWDLARDPLLARERIHGRVRLRLPEGRKNTVAFFGTPEGFGALHQIFVRENRDKSRRLIQAPTWSNPYVTRAFLERLCATYPEQLIAAYVGGRFVNLNSGAVHPAYDRRLNGTNRTMPDVGPVSVFLDFNYGNMCGGEFFTDGQHMYVTGQISKGRDTPSVIELLQERWPGRQIVVYPDASGRAHDTRSGSQTDHGLLAAAGFEVRVSPANPAVRDRIVSVNAALLDGQGYRWLRVNEELAGDIAHALEAQVYDQNGMPEKGGSQDVSHWTEPLGYAVHAIRPAVRPRGAAIGNSALERFAGRAA